MNFREAEKYFNPELESEYNEKWKDLNLKERIKELAKRNGNPLIGAEREIFKSLGNIPKDQIEKIFSPPLREIVEKLKKEG
jgi:predicted nuclease of predicted toxin-antitoxin system